LDNRLLIIEGIEKAERNVLPLLNNLLENREMHLEDGRHLIAPDRYDKLLQVMYHFKKSHRFKTLKSSYWFLMG